MKVIKITAIWCSGCLIMNKVWNNVLKKQKIETISLDYDIDKEEVEKYHVGNILPVFIFEKDNKELLRIEGEKSEKEMIEIIEKLGVSIEK